MADNKAGPTGCFPRGKLNEDDQGELSIKLAADTEKQVVIIDFGELWVGLPPDAARKLATKLSELANMVDGRGGN